MSLPQRRSFYYKSVALVFAVATVLLCSALLIRRQPARLLIETTAPGGRILYDTGYGFLPVDASANEPLGHGSRRLVFPLPNATILKLRFAASGLAAVRSASVWTAGHLDRAFSAADFQSRSGTEIWFRLQPPIYLRRVVTAQNVRLAALCAVGLFVLAVMAAAALLMMAGRAGQYVVRADASFAAWAKALGSDRFIRFDSLAIWFAMACGFLFLVSVTADLNGSAVSLHHSMLGHGAPTRFLLGIAHGVRSDEWGYSTPDILNQAMRAHRFAVETSPLGNHFIALTGNVPVRYFSTLFRPQLWGFFVLPLTYGFSFYWQAKALILTGGVFLLLLLLTGSSRWAAFGSLWYFFSPCTQWCWSWPSALPEMIGMASLAAVCWCYLAVGRNTTALVVSTAGAIVSTVDFAMCAYLPHLIPLFWLAATVVVCWCAAHCREILDPQGRGKRLTAMLCAIGLLAIVGAGVYADLGTAIHLVAETAYPGHRVIRAGSFSGLQFASHLFQWVEAETYIPAGLRNICEASGFLWFAPLTLLFVPVLALTRTQKVVLAGLWVFSLGTLAWLVLPLPAFFGALTGYNRVLGPRALPALGLANVAIVCISLAGLKRERLRKRFSMAASVAAAGVGLALLLWTNQVIDRYFAPAEVILCALLWALLTFLLFSGRKRTFAAAVLVLSAFSFGVVNPVQRGLDVFTHSQMAAFLNRHPSLRDGKWLVYSDIPFDSGFFAALGCEVYTGTRYLPDVDHFALFRARGLNLDAINRLGYVDARAVSPGSAADWTVPSPYETVWSVAPTDPLLRQVGIRYVAFAERPSPEISAGLSPLSPGLVDGFWLYGLPAERSSTGE